VTLKLYRMKHGQEAEIAEIIHGLIVEYGRDMWTELTSEWLRASEKDLHIEVAEYDGAIIGFCAWTLSVSTWRGAFGMYIADIYVNPNTAKVSVMHQLLAYTAKAGASVGCRFMRSDVDISDETIDGVFKEAGFWRQPRHQMLFLEREEFEMLSTTQASVEKSSVA
jgi:hypothetical protein